MKYMFVGYGAGESSRESASGVPDEDLALVLDRPVEYEFVLPVVADYLRARIQEKKGKEYRLERRNIRRRLGEIAALQLETATEDYGGDLKFELTPPETEVALAICADVALASGNPRELEIAACMGHCAGVGWRKLWKLDPLPWEIPDLVAVA